MSVAAVRGVIRRFGSPADPPSDADLVSAFAARRDPVAFAELVRRHGPTVLGACRRVLGDSHDAEDAFQAVFLVLAQKAGSVRPAGAVGGWLYGVAVRTANKAKVAAARRRKREMIAAAAQAVRANSADAGAPENTELRSALDTELARLPEAVRAAVVLCDLHGKTRAEAAAELGCPEGTVAARLHRGRKRLADALARRGFAMPAAGIGAVLVPATLTAALSQSAFALATGTATPIVHALAREVLRSMTTTVHALAIGVIALVAGGLLATSAMTHSPEPANEPTAALVPDEAPEPNGGAPVPPEHGNTVHAVSYSKEGKRFLSVGGGKGMVWDAASQKKVLEFPAEFAAFSGTGKEIFVLEGNEARGLDAATGKVKYKAPRNAPKPVPGGRWAAFTESDMARVEFDGVRHHVTEMAFVWGTMTLADQKAHNPLGSTIVMNHGRGGAFSPDERRFAGIHAATTDYKETACLTVWNIEKGGVRVGTIFRDANHPVHAFAWSPDGKEIAVGYADSVRVYDVPALKEVRKLAVAGPTALAWSKDGKQLAVATLTEGGVTASETTTSNEDGSLTTTSTTGIVASEVAVKVIDAGNGKVRQAFGQFPENVPVVSLAFRPDGKQLLCGAGHLPGEVPAVNAPQPAKDAKGLRVLNLDEPAKPAASAWKEREGIKLDGWLGGSLAYSSDGKTMYVGGSGGQVHAYDLATRKLLWEHKSEAHLAAVAVSPDGKALAATYKDGVRLFDAATGKADGVVEEKGSEPLAVVFYPSEKGRMRQRLVFGSARGWFLGWGKGPDASTINFASGPEGKEPIDRYAVPVAVAPDGNRVFVTGPIDRAKGKHALWAWATGAAWGGELLEGHKAIVTAAAWSRDGKTIVTGDADGVVITWDGATFKEQSRVKLGGRVAALALTAGGPGKPDGEAAEPLAKLTRRDGDTIDINLGTDGNARVGQTFMVLPADYAEKGRASRMRKVRVAGEGGEYKTVERFVPKATIEVTEVLGPDRSRCRITQEADKVRDGAITGDLIYAEGNKGAGGLVAAAVAPQAPADGQRGYTEEVFVWPAGSPPKNPEPISRQRMIGVFAGAASVAFSPNGKTLAAAFCNFSHLRRPLEAVGQVRIFTLSEPEQPKQEPVTWVQQIVNSPDGKRYAVIPGGVFDATGKKLYDVPAEAFGFSADGKTLFAMGNKVLECDTETGKVLKEHPRPKSDLAWHFVRFSPDGKRYAAHFGFNVRVYDTATGFEPVRLANQHEPGGGGTIFGTAGKDLLWSSDGKQLAAVGVITEVGGKMGLVVWDAATGKRTEVHNAKIDDGPLSAAFTPDGDRLAIGMKKDRVEVWVVRGDAKKNPERTYHPGGPTTAIAYSKDGKTVALGVRTPILNGADKPPPVIGHKSEVYVLNAMTGETVERFDGFEGINHVAPTKLAVNALAFVGDGKRLAAGTGLMALAAFGDDVPRRGELKVFSLDGKPARAPEEQKWAVADALGHKHLINGVTFAPDGKSFAAATEGDVTVWDTATRKPLWTHKDDTLFIGVSYSPDGKLIAATRQKSTELFEANTGRRVPSDPPIPGGRAVAFSPDGKFIAVCTGQEVAVRSVADTGKGPTLKCVTDVPEGHFPACLAWSPDGSWLAIPYHEPIDGNYGVDVYDVTTWKAKPCLGHAARITAVAWSKDGKVLVTGGPDGLVIGWDPAARTALWREKLTARDGSIPRTNALAISPADGTVAAAVSLGSGKGAERVVLLDPATGKHVGFAQGKVVPIATVAWSPDGKLLLTGAGPTTFPLRNETGEVVIWERKPE